MAKQAIKPEMVKITGNGVWKITKKQYLAEKKKWDALGTVEYLNQEENAKEEKKETK